MELSPSMSDPVSAPVSASTPVPVPVWLSVFGLLLRHSVVGLIALRDGETRQGGKPDDCGGHK